MVSSEPIAVRGLNLPLSVPAVPGAGAYDSHNARIAARLRAKPKTRITRTRAGLRQMQVRPTPRFIDRQFSPLKFNYNIIMFDCLE